MTATNSTQKSEPKESLLLNLVLNIIIPTVILTKFSGEDHLGPRLSIVIALAFPIAYGLMDFVKQKKINFFSALGVVSVFLTGGISLLELPPKYIAIKEAAIPAALGIATLISTYTKYPLVRLFLYNDKVLATDVISDQLQQRGNTLAFDQALIISSYIVAASFFLSSFLNYMLAKIVVVSQPGTEAFATELGKMTAYSYVVIVIPSIAVMIFAMYYLFRKITRLTGLSLEDIFLDTKGK
jgi:hypothetical protein